MTLKKTNRTFLIFILIFISLVLISAFTIEYQFDYKPCKLCIYQRIPYFIAFLLITKLFFIQKYERIVFSILSIVFIISTILAFYHFGIEQGYFEESLLCANNNFSETLTKEEIMEQLKQNIVSCKDVSFKILGLSLASINIIFSALLSTIFLRLFINYAKN